MLEILCSNVDRIREGTVVDINFRRRSGWTQWLCLTLGGGWVHDISPKDHRVRMVEVEVSRGSWQYQASSEAIIVLPRPSLHLANKKDVRGLNFLGLQEVVQVCERIRPLSGGKGSFLKLADNRGFVFDFVGGQQVLYRWQPPALGGGFSEATLTAGAAPAEVWAEPPPPMLLGRSAAALGPPECGAWDYIVLDPTGICLRGSPTYDKSAKLNSRLAEGEIVEAVERRAGNGTTFLRLETPAGWVFDVQPSLARWRQRMATIPVEHGHWYYRVSTAAGITLRARCSLVDDSTTRKGPNQGTILTICKRVKVGDTTFLRLKDESAWVSDRKDGRELVEGPIIMQLHGRCLATVRASDGVYLLRAPTKSTGAQTNKLLLTGARIQLVHSCDVEGEVWAYVAQPGGMEGWSLMLNFTCQSQTPSPTSRAGTTIDSKAPFLNEPAPPGVFFHEPWAV